MKERWPLDGFNGQTYGDVFERGERPYVEAQSPQRLLDTFNKYLGEYSSLNLSKMNLVFFRDGLQHGGLALASDVLRGVATCTSCGNGSAMPRLDSVRLWRSATHSWRPAEGLVSAQPWRP